MKINSEAFAACLDASALSELLLSWKVPEGTSYETKREIEVCKARMSLLLVTVEQEKVEQLPGLDWKETDLVLSRDRIGAIMLYRERVKCDLLTAKKVVDRWEEKNSKAMNTLHSR